MTLIVGFAGSPSTPSRTKALVEAAAQKTAALSGGASEVYDLTDLGSQFGAAYSYADLDAKARDVLDRIVTADALVVGSPVYKGSYSGLFKHVFDLLDVDALRGKPILLTATGGGHRHALIIEHQLRPLFGFFEAAVVPTGVYASSDEFDDGLLASHALISRLESATLQLASSIRGSVSYRSQDRIYRAA